MRRGYRSPPSTPCLFMCPLMILSLASFPTAVDKGKGKAKKGSSFQTVSALHRVSVLSPSLPWLPIHSGASVPAPHNTSFSGFNLGPFHAPVFLHLPASSHLSLLLTLTNLSLHLHLLQHPSASSLLVLSPFFLSSSIPTSPSLLFISPSSSATGKSEQTYDKLALHTSSLCTLHHSQ